MKDGEATGSIRSLVICMLGVALGVPSALPAHAGSLSDVFREELKGLEMEPLGPALANTVASTYPVASASSSVTYFFNPATETFERTTRVLGPVIGERAETIGRGQLNIGASYSYVDLRKINGDSLSDLHNQPTIGGRVVSFPVPDGVTLADGRFTNFLPVDVMADMSVDAHIATPSVTYGVTPDLDVNLTIPFVRTSLEVDVDRTVPDPRLPQFALKPDDPNEIQDEIRASESAAGIGDVLLRSKYVFRRGAPVDVAAALGFSFPTGDDEDFHGTGDWKVQPALILSRVFAERFEPLLNVGIDINAEDVDRSVVRWAAGATVQIEGPATGALVFLGRHELEEQADKIDAPFFFQIERNDIIDAAIGFRYLFAESGVVAVNFIVPINDDGLRADVIPTVQVEYAFAAPW